MRRHYRKIEDGYVAVKTETRGWVYIEGFPEPNPVRFLAREEKKRFNACLKRRGISQLI